MKKRLFAILLVCAMIFAFPLAASATDAPVWPHAPAEIFVLEDGSVLATDTWYKVVWKIADGKAEIFAGNVAPNDLTGEPIARTRDGSKGIAYFSEPRGIAPFGDGYAVSDTAANVVRLVNADGSVRTLAGSGRTGLINGIGDTVRFNRPIGLAADGNGNVYIADSGNNAIRKIASDGKVTTVVRGLHEPAGLCWYEDALYVAEAGGNRILRVKGSSVEVLAGVLVETEDEGVYLGGYTDGAAKTAEFDHPEGVAVGEDGTVYIADTLNHAIRALKDGHVRTVLRSDDALTFPVGPVSFAWSDGKLLASDRYTGEIKAVETALRTFADVTDDDWFAQYVADAVSRGIIEGDAGKFYPNGLVTKAEFVTMLSRVAKSFDGSTRIDGNTMPEDVTADDWYVKEASWAIENGIAEDSGGWNVPLNRAELALALYNFADSLGLDVSERADLSAFTDGNAVSEAAGEDAGMTVNYIENALQWTVAVNIFEGDAGRLTPLARANRAQAAKVVVAFMDAMGL